MLVEANSEPKCQAAMRAPFAIVRGDKASCKRAKPGLIETRREDRRAVCGRNDDLDRRLIERPSCARIVGQNVDRDILIGFQRGCIIAGDRGRLNVDVDAGLIRLRTKVITDRVL